MLGPAAFVVSTAEMDAVEPLGYLFYVADFRKHTYARLEDVPDYVGLVIPWFVLLSLLEFVVLRLTGRQYDLIEAMASASTGICEQIGSALCGSLSLHLYILVYDWYRLATIPPDSLLCGVGLFLGVDLGYYCFHRCSHEWHAGWFGHATHHSGERYNLPTALRQGLLSNLLFSHFFYWPLALLGFPPAMFAVHKALNLLYQFWIHTELVGWLGPLEYVLNTASHHRVHQ